MTSLLQLQVVTGQEGARGELDKAIFYLLPTCNLDFYFIFTLLKPNTDTKQQQW